MLFYALVEPMMIMFHNVLIPNLTLAFTCLFAMAGLMHCHQWSIRVCARFYQYVNLFPPLYPTCKQHVVQEKLGAGA